jgi:hypothetical protein
MAGWNGRICNVGDRDATHAVGQLREMAAAGIKIRTRAITTTMFARLAVGDLFLHGIGGAKYDELTDLVIERLFGMVAPAYMVLSATVRLPISDRNAGHEKLPAQLRQTVRELTFHPERYVDRNFAKQQGEIDKLEKAVTAKQAWIAAPAGDGQGKIRHEGIVAANAELQQWVAPVREETSSKLAAAASAEAREAILGSREYAFCLFPEKSLRDLLLELSRAST